MRSIRDSRLALEDKTACLLTWDNLYPKLVLNRCGAISTDTMHRMKFRGGIDPELAIIAYYNSIAFAFTEFCGRSYGGGVLESLPKEVGNIDEALDYIDAKILVGVLSFDEDTCRACRRIWKTLQARRLGRGTR